MASKGASEVSCTSVDLGSPAPTTPDGGTLKAFELKASGLRVKVISWGCYINEIHAPDAKGMFKDVVVGFDVPSDFAGYTDGRCSSQYYGAVIGRFGNRIAEGKFNLNGQEYKLAVNNGPNSLHGGEKGWDKRNWDVQDAGCDPDTNEPYVVFGLTSDDMEEGYPAAVDATVRYSIIGGDSLAIKYDVTNKDSTKSTVVNVTNHSYFNLAGDFSKTVLDHVMTINAATFTAVADKNSIPTGELRPVQGTPFDFTAPRRIGERIDEKSYDQIEYGNGFDHNFVLQAAPGLNYCATVFEPTSRRQLECFTTEPGVQFYTGNFMDKERGNGKAGVPLGHRTGFCLETQHFPDSPNQAGFPSTVVAPGACYTSSTVYRFSVGTPLTKPKWQKVKKVQPDMKGINLMLKCVSCEELEDSQPKTWEAVVGDESGIVTLSLRSAVHAELCKPGASLRLQNGKVFMVSNHIRVVVDKWASLKTAEKDADFEPNIKVNVSSVEYELTER